MCESENDHGKLKSGFAPASGALVVSAYAVCPDITATVTPDLKDPDDKGVKCF